MSRPISAEDHVNVECNVSIKRCWVADLVVKGHIAHCLNVQRNKEGEINVDSESGK